MASFLREHPRMIGALFTLLLLVTQAQTALADGADSTIAGP